jgi:hypothetical protein
MNLAGLNSDEHGCAIAFLLRRKPSRRKQRAEVDETAGIVLSKFLGTDPDLRFRPLFFKRRTLV